MSSSKKLKVGSLFLVLLAVAIIVLPLLFIRGTDFSGTDSKASEIVKNIDPDYKPWFRNPFNLESKEMESLMFSVQAALGAGFLGYYIGYKRGKNKSNKEG